MSYPTSLFDDNIKVFIS